MNHLLRACRLIALLAATTALLQAQPSAAPGHLSIPVSNPDEMIGPINMPGDSVDSVLGLMERWTGKAILRPQNLPEATITLVLKEKVTKKEAIQAVETLLSMNGIAVTPLGERFLKATPLALAKSEAPEYIEGSSLDLVPSGRVASKLFQLNFLRIAEFMPQIAGLLNPAAGSPPVVFEKANAALITDSISNIQRIETLVSRLDQPALSGLQPKFYPLHFAKASDVVNKMRALFTGPLQVQMGTATTFSADDRTNQIILVSDSRQYPFFDELIDKLDVKSDPNTRNEVIYLKHATAKDVATILSQLVSGQNNAAKTANADNVARANPGTPNQPPGAQPGAPTPAAPANITAAISSALNIEAGSGNQFSTLLTILPDDRSNSLVVSGTVDDIRLIRELVAKIDTLLAQVRIEVVITEVTLSDTQTSGINALNLTVGPKTNALGQPSGHGTGITNFDTGTEANGIAGWNITGGVVNPLAFQAMLGNTGQNHNVRVLSAPTIVTTHNKEASFVVSQKQPIITGVLSAPSGTVSSNLTTSSQITYQDIGITLKVTPLIGDDGTLQLKIDQIVDDVISNVMIDGNQQPVIGHREANSFVNVNNDEMIVLGGLQRTSKTNDRTKLGFLYEIPILSHLLGGHTNDTERTELLLFIRPHIITAAKSTTETTETIDKLSNKDQVEKYLTAPAAQPTTKSK
jgi:general secretion pathway protein D